MIDILDNLLLSQKDKLFRNDKMRSYECLYFYLKTQSIKCFFLFLFELLCFTRCLQHPHQRVGREISNLNDLGSKKKKTQERRSLKQTNQWLTLTFRWKLNKPRCDCERMRETRMSNLSILFSIVIVVYDNGLSLKILMSH